DVIKGRRRKGKPLVGLNPISQFVGQQIFRVKIWTTRKEKRWCARSKQFAVNPRRRSDGARNSRPEGLSETQLPSQAAAGLKFKSSVIVVFDLGAERQMQPVSNQRDFVLPKRAEPLARDAGREKSQGGSVA